MSNRRFRQLSPEAPELAPIITGLFGEYSTRYGAFFAANPEEDPSELYLPPDGLFIVLEDDEQIIAMGAYKQLDEETAELKRIWTRSDLRRQGLAQVVLVELERRAQLAGYRRLYLTTGFRQPEAVRLYISQGYQPQFDVNRNPEEYSQPPYDGRLRFTKTIGKTVQTGAVNEA